MGSGEEVKYRDLGAGGRMMVKDDRDVMDYVQELNRSPDIYADVKRKLKALDENTVGGMARKLRTIEDQSKIAPKKVLKTMMKDQPDLESDDKVKADEFARRAALKDKRNRTLEADDYSSMKNSFDTNGMKLIKEHERLMRSIHSPIAKTYRHSKHTMVEARKNTLFAR